MPPVFIFHLAGSFGSDEEDETCPPFARHPVVPLPFGGGSTAYHMGVRNVHGTTWDSWMLGDSLIFKNASLHPNPKCFAKPSSTKVETCRGNVEYSYPKKE